ncbi:hypothetical protein [Haladaptatus sp. DFWS20]|uniref:hypothetical protein n=1 Tax=Haladaptatus sp. DFWS20 TaxID=3403467 RepID=UPI003EB73526
MRKRTMKYETNPFPERIPLFHAVRRAMTVVFALVASLGAVTVAGLLYIYGLELAGANVALLLVGWVTSIGVAVMLPFLVVRIVGTILTTFRL